jgi:hypothetical protein
LTVLLGMSVLAVVLYVVCAQDFYFKISELPLKLRATEKEQRCLPLALESWSSTT